jgi:hypothetical protein
LALGDGRDGGSSCVRAPGGWIGGGDGARVAHVFAVPDVDALITEVHTRAIAQTNEGHCRKWQSGETRDREHRNWKYPGSLNSRNDGHEYTPFKTAKSTFPSVILNSEDQ